MLRLDIGVLIFSDMKRRVLEACLDRLLSCIILRGPVYLV